MYDGEGEKATTQCGRKCTLPFCFCMRFSLSVCMSALSADCTLKGGNNGADANDNATGQSERRAVMENVLSTK